MSDLLDLVTLIYNRHLLLIVNTHTLQSAVLRLNLVNKSALLLTERCDRLQLSNFVLLILG